jgi:hypothetical protein
MPVWQYPSQPRVPCPIYKGDLQASGLGGCLNSLDLVEVRLPGLHYSLPAPTISISIEKTDLDVTGKLVPNCSLPYYFTARGTGGSPEPAGTYRASASIDLSVRKRT